MRRVQTKFLIPGMKLGMALFSAEGAILLQENQILTAKYIERIGEAGIPFVYINDADVPSKAIVDIISSHSRAEAIRLLREWIFNTEENRIIREEGSSRLMELINELVGEMRDNPDRCVKFFDIRSCDGYTFAHSVNVCVLSLKTGISMNMTDEELMVLGLSAMLHDIGKVKVPTYILNKVGIYNAEDLSIMEKHPFFGYQIILDDPLINPLVAEIIYQHHERYNGTGYPRKLTQGQIHTFACIIGMADVYDALTSDRSYRRKYLPHEAVEYLYASGNYLFDYELVKKFLKNLALYPVGTLVELCNGEQGAVIDIHPDMMARPLIHIYRDSCNNLLSNPRICDLTKEPTLMIKGVIG